MTKLHLEEIVIVDVGDVDEEAPEMGFGEKVPITLRISPKEDIKRVSCKPLQDRT